jgi:hypothetical protein
MAGIEYDVDHSFQREPFLVDDFSAAGGTDHRRTGESADHG